MLKTFINYIQGHPSNDDAITRRRYTRRSCDVCVAVIDGKTYPTQDWSLGGLLIYGDARPFALDGKQDVLLKFKLQDKVIEVKHQAKVVRKSLNNIAFEFEPLTAQIRKYFQNVVDDYVANEFADSQLT